MDGLARVRANGSEGLWRVRILLYEWLELKVKSTYNAIARMSLDLIGVRCVTRRDKMSEVAFAG